MHTMKMLTTSVFLTILLMLNGNYVQCEEEILDIEADMNQDLEVQENDHNESEDLLSIFVTGNEELFSSINETMLQNIQKQIYSPQKSKLSKPKQPEPGAGGKNRKDRKKPKGKPMMTSAASRSSSSRIHNKIAVMKSRCTKVNKYCDMHPTECFVQYWPGSDDFVQFRGTTKMFLDCCTCHAIYNCDFEADINSNGQLVFG